VKRSIISALAAVAALALSGCGAGMNSQTTEMVPAVPGVNVSHPGAGGVGTVGVRNAALAYPGVGGYKAGSKATLHIWVFNDTPSVQTVVIKAGGLSVDKFTVPAGGYSERSPKITVTKPIANQDAAEVEVEFVRVWTASLQVPVAPPTAPAPAQTIELEH
jgi:hypothetical protein